MDYSAINYVHYNIGLKKEMFVIGGVFAAGLCEPRLARSVGAGGEIIELYISASNFEVMKDFKPRNVIAIVEVGDEKIIIRDGLMRITFHRGVPASWTNESGYLVMDPLPLKHWLVKNSYESWANLMHDKPFEKRMESWELTDAETEFKELCAKHDWYFGYSDDNAVYRNGSANLKMLEERRDQLGGNAKEIFDHYSNK